MCIRKRNPPRLLSALALVIAALTGCSPGRSDRPISADRSAPAVVFDTPVVDLGLINPTKRQLRFDVPFVIRGDGPVVIDSLARTCECTSVGEGLVGEKLFPGKRYTLPLTIELKGTPTLGVRVELNSQGKVIGSLTVRGVVAGDPVPSPSLVRAEIDDAPDRPTTGEFRILRLRSLSNPPLDPAETLVKGKSIEASLAGRDQVRETMSNGVTPDTVTDRLTWRWTTRSKTAEYVEDSLLIHWKDVDVLPTRVQFHLTKASPVAGINQKLLCGTLPPGETWSYTMVLRKSGPHSPKLNDAKPSDESVLAIIKEVSDDLTLVKLRVKAPAAPGAFEAGVILDFRDEGIPSRRIPIIGTVAP